MATREQVRAAMHQQPFRGFTVRPTDGQKLSVHRPDFIPAPETERGRNLVIHDRGVHIIDILRVVSIEVPEPAKTAEAVEQGAA